MSDSETLRIDAGEPYLWRVGDIAVVTTLRVNDKSELVRVTMRLQLASASGDEDFVQRTATLHLTPWKIEWDAGSPLPQPLNTDHLDALLGKHQEELTWRAGRMLLARNRDLWREEDLSEIRPKVLARYRMLFPADFDLIRHQDGRAYLIEDYYCVEPNCNCSAVTLNLIALDDDNQDHQEVGNATIELMAPRLKPVGNKAAATLVRKIMQSAVMQKRVAKRYAECRRIASALAIKQGRVQATVIRSNKVGRNDPCPCGSGKKYKKCCVNKSANA